MVRSELSRQAIAGTEGPFRALAPQLPPWRSLYDGPVYITSIQARLAESGAEDPLLLTVNSTRKFSSVIIHEDFNVVDHMRSVSAMT